MFNQQSQQETFKYHEWRDTHLFADWFCACWSLSGFLSCKGLLASCWVTSSVSVEGASVASWALKVCVYICHAHLHASLATNCITGAVVGSIWISLIMTTTSFGHVFCLEWLKIFFCTGVVSWHSCDYFIDKIKTKGMRHAYPLLWELQHEKKTVFLIFDVHLLIHFYVLVEVWSIYLNFTLS